MASNNTVRHLAQEDEIMTPQPAQRFTPPTTPVCRRHDQLEQPQRAQPHRGGTLPCVLGLAAVGVPVITVASAPAVQATPVEVQAMPVTAPAAPQTSWAAQSGLSATAISAPELAVPQQTMQVAATPATATGETWQGGSGGNLSPFWDPDFTALGPGHGSPTAPDSITAPTPPSQRVVEGTVTVRSGESLWSLTAQLLGPGATDAEVSATWPQLWQANAHHVTDPDLLQPGTVLVLPDSLVPS
ncbi:LysM peptidoglycan-binding domain-containing protein [Kocuria sp. ZOR0020]|uniref:LysM peptidoglycan-binding domain-containing protein n=1 Tax=Kocuria sp. ZOR0020 TaxID=1339234 RepID=UPI00068C63F9|nr:LysM peptidoglycan-binding domain-containing protein [Kocuria sp. ZOR0020]